MVKFLAFILSICYFSTAFAVGPSSLSSCLYLSKADDESGCVNVESVKLRFLPSSNETRILCEAQLGAKFQIQNMSSDSEWYAVNIGGTSCASGTEVKVAWLRRSELSPLLRQREGVVKGAPKGLNVRSVTSPEGKLLCQIPEGQKIKFSSTPNASRDWFRVDLATIRDCVDKVPRKGDSSQYDKIYGYVSRKYVQELEPELTEEELVLEDEAEGAIEELIDETEMGLCDGGDCLKDASGKPLKLSDIFKVLDIPSYENHPDTTKLVNIAIENAVGWRPTRKCYAYVKDDLLSVGLTKNRLGGYSAKNAGYFLKKEGFVNLLDDPNYKQKLNRHNSPACRKTENKSSPECQKFSPYEAPRGSVLVYSGGEHGHIEIKTGFTPETAGFVSDYKTSMARTMGPENGIKGPSRTLIGIYIKPILKPNLGEKIK